jgi:hypothetical protein
MLRDARCGGQEGSGKGRRRLIAPYDVASLLKGGRGPVLWTLVSMSATSTHFTCLSYARRCTLISYELVRLVLSKGLIDTIAVVFGGIVMWLNGDLNLADQCVVLGTWFSLHLGKIPSLTALRPYCSLQPTIVMPLPKSRSVAVVMPTGHAPPDP